jgi:selenocysteine lyase/cysteine desulfurase
MHIKSINPIKYMIDQSTYYGATIDGAQAVPHLNNMQELGVILYFSGHKICGPTGIEFYTEKNQLNKLPAYQGGGEMIRVSLRKRLMLDCLINLKPEHQMLLVESF